MHTIKLNVQDSIYSHIMFLLNSLNQKELEIIEDKVVKTESLDFSEYKVDAFRDIKDPVKWQQEIRDEWS